MSRPRPMAAPKAAEPSEGLDTGPDADPESVARKILLDQLTGRARTRSELADQAGQPQRARRRRHPAARPVRGGRPDRRRRLRPRVGGPAPVRSRAGPSCPGPGAAPQGDRRRGRPRGPRRRRRRGRGRGRSEAGAGQAALGALPRPRQGGPSTRRDARPQGPLELGGVPGGQGRAGSRLGPTEFDQAGASECRPGREGLEERSGGRPCLPCRRNYKRPRGESSRGSAERITRPASSETPDPPRSAARARPPPAPTAGTSWRTASGCRCPPRATRVRRRRR